MGHNVLHPLIDYLRLRRTKTRFTSLVLLMLLSVIKILVHTKSRTVLNVLENFIDVSCIISLSAFLFLLLYLHLFLNMIFKPINRTIKYFCARDVLSSFS